MVLARGLEVRFPTRATAQATRSTYIENSSLVIGRSCPALGTAASVSPGQTAVAWKLPVYNTIWHFLRNPMYAGAYAFGKTES